MLLSEVVFNRALVKTPHPMYDRFWLVSWFVKISPKDLIALWVFPNKDEWEHCTKSKETRRIRDLLMDKYAGDYFVPFKSDNGVYMAAIMSFDYVNKYGNMVNIVGASMTEKSALAAAKKSVEDKGHRWDDNHYSVISMEPRDPSIFRLDPDEDIDAISEGVGSQTLEFADYVNDTVKSEKVRGDFKKLGKALFKDGWEFYRHGHNQIPNLTFSKTENSEDGMRAMTITFPHEGDSHLRQGVVTAKWIGNKRVAQDKVELCHYTYYETAEGINDRWRLQVFKDVLYKSARKM